VLLVDPAAGARALLAAVLTQRGYRVLEASSASNAVALLERHVPRVVLLSAGLQSDAAVFLRRQRDQREGVVPVILYAAAGPVRMNEWGPLGAVAATVADALGSGREPLLAHLGALAAQVS
jgi:CheY-like chemotaxis protein